MKRIILFIFPLFVLLASTFAQKNDALSGNKEVIVEFPDSLVRAHVALTRIQVETNYSTQYYWYNKGVLGMNMGDYTGDILRGEYLVFNKQNKLITKGNFDAGKKTGSWKKWNPDGTLISIKHYDKGVLHGEVITYDENGVVSEIHEYKNGNLVVKEEKERKPMFNRDDKIKNDSIPVQEENINESDT